MSIIDQAFGFNSKMNEDNKSEAAERLLRERFESLKFMTTNIPLVFKGVYIFDLTYLVYTDQLGIKRDKFGFRLMHPFYKIQFLVTFKKKNSLIIKLIPCKYKRLRYFPLHAKHARYFALVNDFESIQNILIKYWPQRFF